MQGLCVGQGDPPGRIDHHDALARGLHRVGDQRLGATALADLARHHGADVVAHGRHGTQQAAEFVASPGRDAVVQASAGDALGGGRRRGQRPADATVEQPRDQRAGADRDTRRHRVEPHLPGDEHPRRLPEGETVARRVIHQQVDLVVHDGGPLIQGFPALRPGRRRIDPPAHLFPGRHRRLDGAGRTDRPCGLRALDGDRQVLGQRRREGRDLGIELGDLRRVATAHPPRVGRLHLGEIGRCRPGVIDGHQRFVVRAVDQRPDVRDRRDRVEPEGARQQTHAEERHEDPAPDRGRQSEGASRRAFRHGPPPYVPGCFGVSHRTGRHVTGQVRCNRHILKADYPIRARSLSRGGRIDRSKTGPSMRCAINCVSRKCFSGERRGSLIFGQGEWSAALKLEGLGFVARAHNPDGRPGAIDRRRVRPVHR